MQPHTLHAHPLHTWEGGGQRADQPLPPKKVTNPFPADTPTLPSSRVRKKSYFLLRRWCFPPYETLKFLLKAPASSTPPGGSKKSETTHLLCNPPPGGVAAALSRSLTPSPFFWPELLPHAKINKIDRTLPTTWPVRMLPKILKGHGLGCQTNPCHRGGKRETFCRHPGHNRT